ncbi:MAG: hypothetical protein HQL68_04535 [Magnetococcales bacterium]|nr:hypothetical protein [Magnetococcales bacterium]
MGWNPITAIIDVIAKPAAEIAGQWQARKTAKVEAAIELQKAKQNFEIVKWTTKAERLQTEATRDNDYDMQVLKNRDGTIADELLIIVFIGVFLAHFVPYTQPNMLSGWKAMGYEGAPLWFEFAILGILVSTLGLMRFFKIFFQGVRAKFQKPNQELIASPKDS